MTEEGGMEEERRLFYVAVTRARRHLILSYPMTMGYEALAFNQVSTFIDEVAPRLFERVELIDSTSRPAFGQRPKRPWEWGGDDGAQTNPWDDPVLQRESPMKPSYAPRLGTKSVWKAKPTTVFKKKPPADAAEPTYVPDPF